MDVKQIARSLAAVVIKIAVAVLVVVLVYKLALSAYSFGFRVFAEKPMSEGEGITVTVSFMEGDTVRDLGQKLYDQGLIRDTKLFYFQELFSDYHGLEQPGVYQLSTSMTVEEMLGKIAEGMPETPKPSDGNMQNSSDNTQDNSQTDEVAGQSVEEDMQDADQSTDMDIELPPEE